MLIFAAGFVALHLLLARSESGIASTLAWLGLVAAIITASTFAIFQAVDGIVFKRAVDSWYASPSEEKVAAFRVAEAKRWTEIGINSIFRILILQGTVAVIFGVAIAKCILLSMWIGAVGVFAGVTTLIAGVGVAYLGFSLSLGVLGLVLIITWFAWLVIHGIYLWRETRTKIISR